MCIVLGVPDAGRAGRALLFVEAREKRLLRNIRRLMKKRLISANPESDSYNKLDVINSVSGLQHSWNITISINIAVYWKIYLRRIQSQENIAAAMMMLLQGKRN